MITETILKQCTVEGLVVKLPDIPLDRKVYLDVKNKLELIGGKWVGGRTKGFVFEEDPTELLADVANGDERNLKKEFQFFTTPDIVSYAMVDKLPYIEEGFKILEPSAGDGALVKAILNGASTNPSGLPITVDCFEIMELNRKKLAKVEGANIIGNDFLEAVAIDTLNLIKGQYDIVFANPPFTKNQDIDHIRAMYECLKPGGILITIASQSWKLQSNKKQKEFSEWLKELNADVTDIPPGSFKEAGTAVGATMVWFTKPVVTVEIEKAPAIETPTRFRLREWKTFILYDAGPYLETTQNKLEIVSQHNQAVEHTIYFERNSKSGLNKSIERAKEWINQNFPDQTAAPIVDQNDEEEKVRTCRVCGCTDDNCKQCIIKTGKPCHWIEEDLCSACEIKEPIEILEELEKTNAEIVKGTSELKKMLSPQNNTDMNFFQQLSATGDVDMTMRIMSKNGKFTINIMPGSNVSKNKPILVTGTPGELDAEFFSSITPSVDEISGLVSNIDEVKQEAKENSEKAPAKKSAPVKKDKKSAATKATPSKKAPVKKKADAKPVKKKVEVPLAQERSIFDAGENEVNEEATEETEA